MPAWGACQGLPGSPRCPCAFHAGVPPTGLAQTSTRKRRGRPSVQVRSHSAASSRSRWHWPADSFVDVETPQVLSPKLVWLPSIVTNRVFRPVSTSCRPELGRYTGVVDASQGGEHMRALAFHYQQFRDQMSSPWKGRYSLPTYVHRYHLSPRTGREQHS